MIPTMSGLISRRDEPLRQDLPGQGWAGPGARFMGRVSSQAPDGTVCVASARVDNRKELLSGLGLDAREWGTYQPTDAKHDDANLIHRAYTRWGADCVQRIYGDWAFAVWHPDSREVFLARDHFGMTSLYYALTEGTFAFASEQQVLIDLNLVPGQIDELYVAQVLVSWPAYHGERTVRTGIKRLPPAHTITVTPQSVRTSQYWFLEDTPELRLKDHREYVEGFTEVFDEAVRARLRRDDGGALGSTLSGGLDSSSITVTAAEMLPGERIQAYTSVPIADTSAFVPKRFGDELPYARMISQHAGNVGLYPVDAVDISPMAGIRRQLEIQQEPGHSAGNAYWMIALNQMAAEQGCSVLLIGQCGNAGLSWAGSSFSQSMAYRWRNRNSVRAWAHAEARQRVPPGAVRGVRRVRHGKDRFIHTAINPEFARRLRLTERFDADPDQLPPRTPLQMRNFLQPGRSFVGALHAQAGRAAGVEIRDPSADARLLAYSWSVPDEVFIDPGTNTDRWLIRTSMAGRLPDEVRLNRNRGRQAGDVAIRLRRSVGEVEAALDEVASGPAADVVDARLLRRTWEIVRTEDTPESFRLAVTTLTRGLMAGLFVAEEAT